MAGYQEYRYHTRIENICKELFKSGDVDFKEINYVPIYENELKVVNNMESSRKKKLMFTFFAVARYMNCDGWINKKTSKDVSEVFKLANVNVTSDIRNQLLHELYEEGYITFAKRIDNLNFRVELDDTGEIVYKVSDFNNIGNQYLGNFREGYRQCVRCGKAIKITGSRKKYCSKCAREVQLEQMKEHSKMVRNQAKNKK